MSHDQLFHLKAENQLLQAQVHFLCKENEQLQGDQDLAAQLKQQVDHIEQEYADLREALASRVQRYGDLDQRIDLIKSQIARMQAHLLEQTRALNEELGELRQSLAPLDSENPEPL